MGGKKVKTWRELGVEDFERTIFDVEKRLEAAEELGKDAAEWTKIKDEIDRLIEKYGKDDVIFDQEYKMYELKAKMYFYRGNEKLARKYVEQAVAVRQKEKDWGSDEKKTGLERSLPLIIFFLIMLLIIFLTFGV